MRNQHILRLYQQFKQTSCYRVDARNFLFWLDDHLDSCKFCNGFSISKIHYPAMNSIIRCSCGASVVCSYFNQDMESLLNTLNYNIVPINIEHKIKQQVAFELKNIKMREEILSKQIHSKKIEQKGINSIFCLNIEE